MDTERVPVQRSLRQHSSTEEYLDAVREDLSEWLDSMYPSVGIDPETFFTKLETGVVLCNHTNRLIDRLKSPQSFLAYRTTAQPATFQARDNLCNFLHWCRQMKVKDCLLFETDDLVLRKNDKNVLLCIMEVARMGAKLGLPAPTLIQFEKEIDAAESGLNCNSSREDDVASSVSTDSLGSSGFSSLSDEPSPGNLPVPYLKNIDQVVDERVKVCRCSTPFPLTKVSPGKYRIGPTQLTIYVRILRNHVMVRVGGGWDTLDHFLEKHDPCRRGNCPCGDTSRSSATPTSKPHALPSAVPLNPKQRRHSIAANLTALQVVYKGPNVDVVSTTTNTGLPLNKQPTNSRTVKRRSQTTTLTPITRSQNPPKQKRLPREPASNVTLPKTQSSSASTGKTEQNRTRSRMQNLASKIPASRSSNSTSQPPAPLGRKDNGSTKNDPWDNAMQRHRQEFLRTRGIFEPISSNVTTITPPKDREESTAEVDQKESHESKDSVSTVRNSKDGESAEEGFFSDASACSEHSPSSKPNK